MSKIFLTGSSGLLGNYILFKKKKIHKFTCSRNKKKINHKNVKIIRLNLLDKKKLINKLKKINFDLIIHCAGYTNVEGCEKNFRRSYKQNFITTKNLVEFCKLKKKRLIYISSDHIFDGKNKFYKETSTTKGLNNYAKHKILSEKYITNNLSDYLIVRTNFVGNSLGIKDTFNETIKKKLSNGIEVNLWNNIYFTPISLDILIKCLFVLIKKKQKGIINISGNDRLSKYEFGIKFAVKSKLNKNLIKKTSFDKNKFVLRPREMSLSNKKLRKIINFKIPSIDNILKKL